jgi:hypothetical protein
MSQAISNAYRIQQAESAIAHHAFAINNENEKLCCDENDAIELLKSLALWAEVNGVCLRLQKPVFASTEGGEL